MAAGTNEPEFTTARDGNVRLLTLVSSDGMHRLTRRNVNALREEIESFCGPSTPAFPLVITGDPIFSAGADLNEVSRLRGTDALAFARMGQDLMNVVTNYPAPVYAAIQGYCLGGGLDLALACHYRIASPNTVFGHRGAALGLITGWGGTQRLPRLVGKGRALEMFVAAEKIVAPQALRIGLLDAIAEDPVAEAVRRIRLRLAERVDR